MNKSKFRVTKIMTFKTGKKEMPCYSLSLIIWMILSWKQKDYVKAILRRIENQDQEEMGVVHTF